LTPSVASAAWTGGKYGCWAVSVSGIIVDVERSSRRFSAEGQRGGLSPCLRTSGRVGPRAGLRSARRLTRTPWIPGASRMPPVPTRLQSGPPGFAPAIWLYPYNSALLRRRFRPIRRSSPNSFFPPSPRCSGSRFNGFRPRFRAPNKALINGGRSRKLSTRGRIIRASRSRGSSAQPHPPAVLNVRAWLPIVVGPGAQFPPGPTSPGLPARGGTSLCDVRSRLREVHRARRAGASRPLAYCKPAAHHLV
jgi:hypothetical protein